MLGPASLQRLPKASSKSSCVQSKRCVRLCASFSDPNVFTAAQRREESQRPGDARHVAACISAIAAQMVAANVVWADVPLDEVFTLQGAQPLTELSSGASAETPAEVVAEALETPAIAEISIDSVAESQSAVVAMAEEPADSVVFTPASTPSVELASAAVEDIAITPVAFPEVDVPAQPAVASPVISMDMPAMPAINADTDIKTLVAALIRNEQFISALVNNEAFLDRLAGEDRVVEELARRKGLSTEVEARGELATELLRRQQMMDALAARGEEAVLAVADAARQAAKDAAAAANSETREADVTGEVGVVSSGKSALVAMGTAVELLEDSQELLATVESNPGGTPLSALMDDNRKLQREFNKMEAAVASAEKSVSKTLEKTAAEPLRDIQEAVRELYAEPKEQQDDMTINRAYTDLVTAVAEMQRAYGSAISKAVGHAVAEVVEVEEAAVKGAEKTKVLVSQKVEEVEKVVGFNPAPPRSAPKDQTAAAETSVGQQQDVGAEGLRYAVIGAFVFWFWGTFIQPRSRYSR